MTIGNALTADEPDLLAPQRRARPPVHAPSLTDPWRADMPSKLIRIRTGAVVGLAVLSIGSVAAAATGMASPAAERAATQASPGTRGGQVGHAQGDAATQLHGRDAAAAPSGSVPDKPKDDASGPDASGAARHGLCRAWSAGQGDDHGKRADSTAFQALVAAAGGVDQVPAYCQADPGALATHKQRPAAPPSSTSRGPQHPSSRPLESSGQGHGQGGPPTTT